MIALPSDLDTDPTPHARTDFSPRASAAAAPALATLTLIGSTLGLAFQGVVLYPPAVANLHLSDTSFQWLIDGKPATTGTSTDYVPYGGFVATEAYVGKQVSVIVSGTDNTGAHVSFTSNSLPVINVNDAPHGSVVIDPNPGTAGTTLHATSTITDADGIGPLTYDWMVDGQFNARTNTGTWTPPDVANGKQVTVVAHYFDGHGHLEVVGSSAPPLHQDQGGTTTIAGTLAAGQALRADVYDPDGLDQVFYQWQVSDTGTTWTNLAGATGRSVTLGASAPALVRVLTNYSDDFGNVRSDAPILATDGADTIKLNTPSVTVFAAGGNDTIYYTSGQSYIDGGTGLDTFVSPATQSSSFIGHTAGTHTWGVETVGGQVATLVDVERIKFSDISLALDIDGVAGQVFRLYQAAFDRKPDTVGTGFWISQMDHGTSETAVAQAFINSDEFGTLYGNNPSHADLVTKLYQNVLHRAPEAGGYQFWVDALDRHAVSVADVLVSFSDSPENVAALLGAMNNGIPYVPYG